MAISITSLELLEGGEDFDGGRFGERFASRINTRERVGGLRHSAGYALSNKGHDFRLLQDFMGHRDPRHTSRYTRTASWRFEGLWK